MKQVQRFFQDQTPAGRTIWSIGSALALFVVFYNLALNEVGKYSGDSAFNLSMTSSVWFLYIVVISLTQYVIWVPPSKD
ncbi:hypothetical protein [Spirosoma sordidisoli]|uniref:Uncharacterized protein n=1 Tax=Spirosoma sordidisoli TaxID=2502893 RepID=A0A4Q2UM58_9BACT|nr:hypothetical protein [Spirosoma sordidisoli]RYC70673.1 hypothetical protein EQG79_00545 [Spirosoma sordidisoli]